MSYRDRQSISSVDPNRLIIPKTLNGEGVAVIWAITCGCTVLAIGVGSGSFALAWSVGAMLGAVTLIGFWAWHKYRYRVWDEPETEENSK